MRLIDADVLIADLEKWKQNPNNDDSSVDLVNHFQGILRMAPSIDIVRCKECRNYYNQYGDSTCMLHTDWSVNADDFCSYGERRE